ncbi:phosphogluconate dehydrogenase (NADP(+)-dependent, decarboxylating) [Candidatus Peregrinibacteria bacterium CG10_big_fil_rev_8_21_14_0_10_49_24]|nr:MAG: phosphogluconate dehydrogenase (NADP(+)-dependent, decarboxylating) [Candidatus Peregrinibacteria bacterium CG11_big_fil_rev_8_21_14_0_20_49_14]PIR50828.1 MAG: phosphogluconate dehydrogenase (NADP(+)-dependent, decarboxylating) [Candidatus Peregrinibacteria bacterium CG10_big_fil_rev_8_21_14_0_10_49_24]
MQVGVIGLGTMGANLARNAARNEATVAIYNRTAERTDVFMKDHGEEGNFIPCTSYEQLTGALEGRRAILIMVKAGDAVDTVIEDLLPFLSEGDILIDAGNSLYTDTNRRVEELRKKKIHFIGMGVSGGEEGALHGPSMMPGGDMEAYKYVEPLLMQMAADDGDGGKCVTYIGPGGAGHFVKMVHNGIEYGVMQLMAECYDLLKSLGEFSNQDLHDIFTAWNDTEELHSYLSEITAQIFLQKEKDTYIIDLIRDKAGQKGTGKWTTQAALDLGVAIPTINAAVDARILSGSTAERAEGKNYAVHVDNTEPIPRAMKFRSSIRSSMELSSICAYGQGFVLIQKASSEFDWSLNLSEIARIWRGGCIIRSSLLKKLQNAYSTDSAIAKTANRNLLDRFDGDRQIEWRQVVELGISWNIPVPALSASLTYFDTLTRKNLPQNLIQAQRDFFGAHGYERTDKEGSFHTQWAEGQK